MEFSYHLRSVAADDITFSGPGLRSSANCFIADIVNIADYSPFGVQLDCLSRIFIGRRTITSDKYRYGYQGSESDDEVSGEGNSYTTHFRQLDPRIARWKSIDPKLSAWESPYVSMGNNPILYNDKLGDTIRTNKAGADTFIASVEGFLNGVSSPFGYDSENEKITFDKDFDRTKYNDEQLKVIDGLAVGAESKLDVGFNVIDGGELIPKVNQSLDDLDVTGLTVSEYNADKELVSLNVYVSSNPKVYKNIGGDDIKFDAPPSTISISTIHEVGGHVNLRLTKPELSQPKHNQIVEDYETVVRSIYVVGHHTEKSAKRQNRKNKRNGIANVVKIGDPIFLGGQADKH